MKILSIAYTDIWPWGKNKGIPSIFYPQKGFVDKGHEVLFLCPQKDAYTEMRENCEGVKIFRFRLPFGLSFYKIDSLPIVSLASRIKASFLAHLLWILFQPYCLFYGFRLAGRFKPDIIYVHSLGPAYCGFLLSWIFKTRLIIRVYGVKDLYWNWDDILFRIKEWQNYLAFKIPADYFIITNDGTGGEKLAGKMGVPEHQIRHWRNGIDFSGAIADPQSKDQICQELGLEMNSKIVLSTCRLIPIYQVNATLKIMIEVLKRNKDAVFVIAGDGPDREQLESYISELPERSQFRFIGAVERSEINTLLNICDIFVLLSKHHNCTNTMWEAMICGACIVTTKTESIEEIMGENDAVLIPGNELSLAIDVLDTLLRNDDLRQELGKSVKAKAKDILETWPQRVEKEICLLEGMIKDKSKT